MRFGLRDTILVIGPSAAGKTEILNTIRGEIKKAGIPQIFEPHSDSHTILVRMHEDDARGGYGHYHPWCDRDIGGHSHDKGEPTIPFTVAGNGIAHGMMLDFFDGLGKLPNTGKLRYAEWSGGRNTNPFGEPAAQTDLSFGTIGRLLKEGKLSRDGLQRVLAVIHPETEWALRERMNGQRQVPTDEQIRLGTASWPLDETAMRIFGEDDFGELNALFKETKIPYIFSIHNDGGLSLIEGARRVLPEMLQGWQGKEGGRSRSPER